MGISSRNRKRIFIFLVIPILTSIPIFTDDPTVKIISSVVLIIYVGFIIFLRDSVNIDEKFDDEPDSGIIDEPVTTQTAYETDEGEDFKIISSNRQVEVITADTYTPVTTTGKRKVFKPPDLKKNFDKIATEELPEDISHDEQFSFVLEKLLNVSKEAFIAHTGVFFWYNKSKKGLTLEKYVSSSSDITEQKFELEDDVLSKIVLKEEPELLTEIAPNAESDVIRYYNKPQGIKSFVGVPLFYEKSLTGVLALDSKVSDAFGIETIYSLGRFVRVISIIISLFEEKFKESQSEQRLKALLGVLSTDNKFTTPEELHNALESAVQDLIPWDAFTFVYYDSAKHSFYSSKIVNHTSLKYIGENLEIELNGTIVGKAIISGMPVKIDNISAKEFFRFTKSEDVTFDGSFLAIPLIYDEQNYGVLCFESLKKNIYNNADIQFMKKATKIFSFIVYSYSTHSILKGLLSVDPETKTLNRDNFVERMAADLVKAQELGIPGAVALIQIDEFLEQDSLFEGDPFPKVLNSISSMIKNELTPISTLGRISEKVFGVYFFNSSTKDVFLWAEKLRIKIARNPVSVVSKQSTFTVSIGIASSNNKVDVDEVLNNAELALNKALEKGGNAVKSIN